MKDLKNRKHLFAVLVLLAVFAGCKGEDPTAPPPSSGPGTGSGTPPVGASVTLTVANPNPLVNSSTTITATVTLNGQPVPNGTAVEFGTTIPGVFTDTGSRVTIKTTTNGVATATLTATTAGTANVTAVVNNVVARTTVTFQPTTTGPPPTDATPAITAVSPTSGRPDGGETITLTGRNFRGPVRVFFDIGGGRLVEGAVTGQTSTQVQVLTPKIDLGTGQTLSSVVILINEAGTPSEVRIQAGTTFTFRRAILTPSINGISPASGPLEGGTQVTIFGDAFESLVQVFFGAAEARVTNVNFSQIIVISPPSRDASPDGTSPVTGQVTIRVRNITSGTETTSTDFRYMPGVVMTAVAPNQGVYIGGTRFTIDGTGFDDPVAVTTAGIAASIIRVAGTQITAITNGVTPAGCTDVRGPITITNVNTGAGTSGLEWIYRVIKPAVINIARSDPADPTINPGETISITGFNLENVRAVEIGGRTLFLLSRVTNPDGSMTIQVVLPLTGFNFPTGPCVGPGGALGTSPQPLTVSITIADVVTTCTFTANNAITIEPIGAVCTVAPAPRAQLTQPAPPGCSIAADTVAAGAATATTTVIVANSAGTGAQSLTVIASITAGAADFSVSPATGSAAPGGTASFTVTFDPQAVGARTGTLTLTTNDPANPTITVCLQGNGI